MKPSAGAWTIQLIRRTLEVAVGNPYTLVRFVPRVLNASGLWAKTLLSREAGTVVGPIVSYTTRSFFRGIWLILALGLALAAGLRAAALAVGPLIQPIAEQAAIKILVVDGIPLLLAVFLSGRVGATMAAKLGPLPALRGLRSMRIRTSDIHELILPSLAAGPITAVAFYLVILLVGAAGYQAIGPLPGAALASFELAVPETWRAGVGTGLGKSAIFGFVVAYVGAALGVHTAERYRRDEPETTVVHQVVWESSALGVILCLFVSVFWSSLD